MTTVTFAHLSDVHLPLEAPLTFRHLNLKRVLGWLNWQTKRRFVHTRAALDAIVADARAQNPAHFLVSGDLIDIGLPGEYEAAARWLATLGPPDKVSVVPGNHDIYCADTAGFAAAHWGAYMASDAFGRGVRAAAGVAEGEAFAYVRRVGPVAIVGVNSAEPTAPGVAAGLVGPAQMAHVAAVLDRLAAEGCFRLVMIHHPPLPGQAPHRRALADAEAFADVVGRADLAIHGHNHVMSSLVQGGCAVEGVASASAARALGEEPPARYNLISITQENGRHVVRIETRGIDPELPGGVSRIAVRTFEAHTGVPKIETKGQAL